MGLIITQNHVVSILNLKVTGNWIEIKSMDQIPTPPVDHQNRCDGMIQTNFTQSTNATLLIPPPHITYYPSLSVCWIPSTHQLILLVFQLMIE